MTRYTGVTETTTPRSTTPEAGKGELRGTGGMQYWLYSKSNGTRFILGVEPSGNIATITVQGPPNNQIRTSRGIGLGSSYFDLINFYGYPETSSNTSSGLRINYSDQDVIFLLQNLQVTEITIGKPPALAPQAKATTARTQSAGPSERRLRPEAAGRALSAR